MNKTIICPKCGKETTLNTDRITKGISFELYCSCGEKALFKIPVYTQEMIFERLHSFN